MKLSDVAVRGRDGHTGARKEGTIGFTAARGGSEGSTASGSDSSARSSWASRECRRVCGSSRTGVTAMSSLVMSTSTTAASLPAAAVTIFRVYCS